MSHHTSTSTDITRRSLLFGRHAVPAGARLAISETCLPRRGVSCRACEDACEHRAIRFEARAGGTYQPVVQARSCTACGDCLAVCPVTAISVSTGVPA